MVMAEEAGLAAGGAEAPAWFRRALATAPAEGALDVAGCRIRTSRWGGEGGAPLVLVHGNSAHSGWWRFIAPLLARERTVMAFDFGGMGDSGERADYSPDLFVEEIAAVIGAASADGATGAADVVAHSFGGLMSMLAVGTRAELFRRLIVIDTPFYAGNGPLPGRPSKRPGRRWFASREAALAAFRLLPAQPCDNPFILSHVAENAVRREPEGWTWKFRANPWDYPGFQVSLWNGIDAALSRRTTPIALIRGALSTLCDEATVRRWQHRAGAEAPVVTIPEAHHHIMLDQPLALVAAIEALLAGWARPG